MNIFRNISEIEKFDDTIISIGTFDGVHLGHREIFNTIKEKTGSSSRNLIITFEPHPRKIINKYDVRLLTTIEDKILLFEKNGIQNLLIIEFTKDFANNTYEDFIAQLKTKVGISNFVIGYDHKFGKNRDGNEDKLRELGTKMNFIVHSVKAKYFNDKLISSTVIRNLLLNGDVKTSSELLGRYYSLKGRVVEGSKRGREIGFPTANIEQISKDILIPAMGVYLVKCEMDNISKYGMLNIGLRPTFGDVINTTMEVNIFDFNDEIYDSTINIIFIERIREEIKFNSIDDLKSQLEKDKIKSLEIIKQKSN